MLIIQQYSNESNLSFDVAFSDAGWFNATEAAKRFGKKSIEWLRLPDTEKYIAALCKKAEVGKSHFVKTKKGGSDLSAQGTWLHPKLAVRFAQWLSVDFAIWCDEQIDSLLRGTHAIYDKRKARDEAASSYKVMSGVMQIKRQIEGKEVKPCHFMTEAKLVNWVHSGEFKALDRDSMTAEQLKLMAKLEEQNAVFLGMGMDYETRKLALYGFAELYRKNQSKKIEAANCAALPVGKSA